MLYSSDSLKLPGAYVWTERHIQLRVVSVAVNRGKVHLDDIKQFACINREKIFLRDMFTRQVTLALSDTRAVNLVSRASGRPVLTTR